MPDFKSLPTQPAEPVGPSAAQIIRELAELAASAEINVVDTEHLGPGLPEQVPFLYDPRERRPVSLKPIIEEMRLAPRAREGVATVETLQSFIALVSRHKDENSAIFGRTAWPGADSAKAADKRIDPELTAVIDYHAAGPLGAPRFGRHRVVYRFPITEEFRVWVGQDGRPMEQADFAAFLEDHAAELAAPFDGERSEYERLFKERFANPAELLSLSRSLEVHVGAKVKRSERLQTGERTVYFAEEHMNGAGEPIEIPGIFMVSLPAFLDGEPVRIPARLRYRLSGGSIAWFYQLYRWEFWLRERVAQDLARAGRETGLPTFEGEPERLR